ncbi:GDSL esterase/lipase [Platanthera zijinensis]|uniref:GDSL esterase/lipase n=1 Tax=Platanthera zijinensis TaxID=2320716 RepID=A0AAP0G1B1_9ASPA
MVKRKRKLLQLLFLFLLAIGSTAGRFTSIFSFGDSIAHTENLLISRKGKIPAARSPYGRAYFHRPTGRFLDGQLINDFIGLCSSLVLSMSSIIFFQHFT